MTPMSADEFARKIGAGLLSFPVTHFTDAFDFDEGPYREHLEWLLQHKPAALFAAGGTGEFFSLTLQEFSLVVSAAVQQTNHRAPVVAGCGYGTAMAKQFVRAAETAGADGLLLFPPYLLNSEPAGIMAHVEAVCASTRLGVVFYNRDNAIINEEALERLCARCQNLVGFKDGYGDIELMTRIYARMGDRLTYIGGLPTAETFALPYLEMGVTTYSSAIFNFLPSLPRAFTPRCAGATTTRSSSGCGNLFCLTSTFATGVRVTLCRSSKPACASSAGRRARCEHRSLISVRV